VRMYLAFMAPFEQDGDFRDTGIRGTTRFLERVHKLNSKFQIPNSKKSKNTKLQMRDDLTRLLHKTIKKVTEDIENLQYNTAISALMILLNAFEASPDAVSMDDIKIFLKLLAPFAPHIAEELWQGITRHETRNTKHEFKSIHREPWPMYDPKLIQENTFELVVQVNGKMRGRVTLPMGAGEAEAIATARGLDSVKPHLSTPPRKVIFVPDRLVNFVV
ncbi:MAG: class I tRNA ligase family protein, partial [Candidatus Sungiibacteriota bacterium]